MDELNDAVGASGVDIAVSQFACLLSCCVWLMRLAVSLAAAFDQAEEERMRDGDKITAFNPGLDRSRKQTFLLPADIAAIIRPIGTHQSELSSLRSMFIKLTPSLAAAFPQHACRPTYPLCHPQPKTTSSKRSKPTRSPCSPSPAANA